MYRPFDSASHCLSPLFSKLRPFTILLKAVVESVRFSLFQQAWKTKEENFQKGSKWLNMQNRAFPVCLFAHLFETVETHLICWLFSYITSCVANDEGQIDLNCAHPSPSVRLKTPLSDRARIQRRQGELARRELAKS